MLDILFISEKRKEALVLLRNEATKMEKICLDVKYLLIIFGKIFDSYSRKYHDLNLSPTPGILIA